MKEEKLPKFDDSIEPVMPSMEFVKKCYATGERGDALLFAAILKNYARYESNTDSWYFLKDGKFILDETFRVYREVDLVAQAYEKMAESHNSPEQAQAIGRRAYRLRSYQKIEAVVTLAPIVDSSIRLPRNEQSKNC